MNLAEDARRLGADNCLAVVAAGPWRRLDRRYALALGERAALVPAC